jgi:hypothetical protein
MATIQANNCPAQAERRDEIRKTLALLLEPGQVAELRILKTTKGTQSGYFDDFDALAAAAAHDGQAPIYITLNPVHRSLLARQRIGSSRMRTTPAPTETSSSVVVLRSTLLDAAPRLVASEMGSSGQS